MYGFDPKELLRKKTEQLNELLVRYSRELNTEEKDKIMIALSHTYETISGNLDLLDYNVRGNEIMQCNDELNRAILICKQFEPRENEMERD